MQLPQYADSGYEKIDCHYSHITCMQYTEYSYHVTRYRPDSFDITSWKKVDGEQEVQLYQPKLQCRRYSPTCYRANVTRKFKKIVFAVGKAAYTSDQKISPFITIKIIIFLVPTGSFNQPGPNIIIWFLLDLLISRVLILLFGSYGIMYE